MSKSISDELGVLALGEGAVIRGVRVVRRSLLGFQVAAGKKLLDAEDAAAAVRAGASSKASSKATVKGRAARVDICFRCGGGGLGRRNRGECGVCHGRGIQVIEPAMGWDAAPATQVTTVVAQAVRALREARCARAREGLTALLARLTPKAAATGAFGELRRCGVEGERPAIEATSAA